jgi:hydrogenase maturation protease
MTESGKKVLLGLGNLLYRDEGFGIHALHRMLGKAHMVVDIEFVDGGVLGLNLLPLVEECSHLLVLDAIDAGQSENEIAELVDEEIPLFAKKKLSEHQVGFQEVLGLARFLGQYPKHLRVIGVKPVDVTFGIGLSPSTAALLPHVIERACSVLRQWQACLPVGATTP